MQAIEYTIDPIVCCKGFENRRFLGTHIGFAKIDNKIEIVEYKNIEMSVCMGCAEICITRAGSAEVQKQKEEFETKSLNYPGPHYAPFI